MAQFARSVEPPRNPGLFSLLRRVSGTCTMRIVDNMRMLGIKYLTASLLRLACARLEAGFYLTKRHNQVMFIQTPLAPLRASSGYDRHPSAHGIHYGCAPCDMAIRAIAGDLIGDAGTPLPASKTWGSMACPRRSGPKTTRCSSTTRLWPRERVMSHRQACSNSARDPPASLANCSPRALNVDVMRNSSKNDHVPVRRPQWLRLSYPGPQLSEESQQRQSALSGPALSQPKDFLSVGRVEMLWRRNRQCSSAVSCPSSRH